MNLQRRPRFYGYAALAVCCGASAIAALVLTRDLAAFFLVVAGCLLMAAAYSAEESP